MPAPLLLLTGAPGIGKTTILQRVAEAMGFLSPRGFLTAELRSGGRRRGFKLQDFGGREITLAHDKLRSAVMVGKYGVDLEALERFAPPALRVDAAAGVYLVDEIGKMECASPRVCDAVRALLDGAKAPVVATVSLRGGGLIAEVKARPGATLWELTLDNRGAMTEAIVHWIMQARGRG